MTKARIYMHYTSNERYYFYFSIHVFYFENKCENRKRYLKTLFFHFYFSIVHISTNYAFDGLRIFMHVTNIHVEGTVSQIFVLGLVLILCQKTGNFLYIFVNIFFLHLIKNDQEHL